MDKEQTKAKTLAEIMIQYKDQQPIRFGHDGLIERCYPTTAIIDIVKEYNGQFVSKIDELEAQNKELTDKYSIIVHDYSSKFYEQAKEIRELREALEKIANCDYHPDKCIQEFTENLLYIAEQALNEDKQDG